MILKQIRSFFPGTLAFRTTTRTMPFMWWCPQRVQLLTGSQLLVEMRVRIFPMMTVEKEPGCGRTVLCLRFQIVNLSRIIPIRAVLPCISRKGIVLFQTVSLLPTPQPRPEVEPRFTWRIQMLLLLVVLLLTIMPSIMAVRLRVRIQKSI